MKSCEKAIIVLCLAFFLTGISYAGNYPPDLKQIRAGDWKIERIDIQDSIARIVDAISTQTFIKGKSPATTTPVRFTLEGWDEATSTSIRPNRNMAEIWNYNEKRFALDTHGKNLEEVLDMVTKGHGGYIWRYDADNGVVNVIEKRLAESPAWAFNQPLPDSLKGENVTYPEIVKLFRKLKFGEFFIGNIQIWETGKLSPLSVPPDKKLKTVRDLVNYCVGQKKEKDPGVYEVFLANVDNVEPNLKKMQEQGIIPEWAIGWSYALSTSDLERHMRISDSVLARVQGGENIFAKWDQMEPVREGIQPIRVSDNDPAYDAAIAKIYGTSISSKTLPTATVTPLPTPVVAKPAERKTNWALHVGIVLGVCLLGGIGFVLSKKRK